MGRYAVVNNNTVTEIIEIEDDAYTTSLGINQLLISIDGAIPEPKVGFVLNGNLLEVPQGHGDREEYEYALAVKKTDFGIKLSRVAVDRIGARNKILNKSGAQVGALLSVLISVKLLLETGALGTARYSCSQLKIVYTEYSDIFDNVIEQITSFESSNGL